MSVIIKISLNEGLYLRDPQDSKLGRKIIKNSIVLINRLGIESFTFKKLATEINSTEATIYRYFENKHLLLIYLVSWYYEWVNFLIELNTKNVELPEEQLKIIIKTIILASEENPSVEYVQENLLFEVVVAEGLKVFHTKEVDKENQEGFFLFHKNLIRKIADTIILINPNFVYPNSLASNLLNLINNSIFDALHFPKLTDIKSKTKGREEVEKMVNFMIFKALS